MQDKDNISAILRTVKMANIGYGINFVINK